VDGGEEFGEGLRWEEIGWGKRKGPGGRSFHLADTLWGGRRNRKIRVGASPGGGRRQLGKGAGKESGKLKELLKDC